MSDRPVLYDQDANSEILNGKTVAVIGYGAQGRAQARMLFESGVNVIVGVRENGPSHKQAIEDGLPVATISEAASKADIIHILIPDENHKKVFLEQIEPNLKPGATLSFSHGFSIVFKQIVPSSDFGVIMVAPKSPGTEEYKRFKEGFGVPTLTSVYQENAAGNARDLALGMAKAMRFTKAGVMECTFQEEAYEDLFGEQAVLCGGVTQLVKYGFETLVEAGYPSEFAYFECLHELKLIVDLMYEGGLTKMWEVVSNTAEYGGHTRGSRVVGPEVKERMKEVLKEVQDGTFAKEWINECENNNMQNLLAARKAESEHEMEKVGIKIRSLFKKD